MPSNENPTGNVGLNIGDGIFAATAIIFSSLEGGEAAACAMEWQGRGPAVALVVARAAAAQESFYVSIF